MDFKMVVARTDSSHQRREKAVEMPAVPRLPPTDGGMPPRTGTR